METTKLLTWILIRKYISWDIEKKFMATYYCSPYHGKASYRDIALDISAEVLISVGLYIV